MAQFLSRKYLKYRDAIHGATIDRDQPCLVCGYNVRGLHYGRNCPECGAMIEKTPGQNDIMLSGDWSERMRWRIGLGLLAGTLALVALARMWFFVSSLAQVGSIDLYVTFGAIAALAWVVGVWLVTPATIDRRRRSMGWWRWGARLTQFGWIAAYAVLFIAYVVQNQVAPSPVFQSLARAVAAVGVLLLIPVLRYVADEAELEDASRRLYRVAWLLPLLTAAAWVLSGPIVWCAAIPLSVFLLGWVIVLAMFALSVWQMERHVAWSMRFAVELPLREQRIAATKAELLEEVEARIRPVSGKPPADLHLDDEDDDGRSGPLATD